MSYITQKLNSSLVKLNQTFRGLFVDHPVDNLQEALEVIDDNFAPLLEFDRDFGSYPIQDKEMLYFLNDSITDLYFLLETFDSNLVDIDDQLNLKFEEYKLEIDGTVQNYLDSLQTDIDNKFLEFEQNLNEVISDVVNNTNNNLQEQIDVLTDEVDSIHSKIDTIGNYSLVSSFASFTYESYEPSYIHTITHNMNTFSLLGEPMVLNDEGIWEKDIVPLIHIDENTIEIRLTEERQILLNMTAVEYFPSYIYEGVGKVFELSHMLNSYNIIGSLLIYDGQEWSNDIGKIQYINENDIKIELVNESPIKLNLMRI